MLKNYLLVAFRHLKRQRGYTLINVFSLSLGIACCLLIFLYVQDEVNHDTFHKHRDALYRVVSSLKQEHGRQQVARTPMPMGPMLQEEFADVNGAVRFWAYADVVKQGAVTFTEQLTFADPDLFRVFSFPLQAGQPSLALQTPEAVVLSAPTARKYFGEADPIGQPLSIKLVETFYDFTVAGVLAPLPGPSSIRFDLVLPFARVEDVVGAARMSNWRAVNTHTYVRLSAANPDEVARLFPAFVARHLGAEYVDTYQYALQPLADVHLNPDVTGGMRPASRPAYSYILSGLALLVLLIACINFMNLSIAGATGRMREIGVRKVVGAGRGALMRQFWGEALLLSGLALLLGIGLAELFLPVFNTLAQKELALVGAAQPSTLAALLGVMLFTGLVAGSYPALLLSRFPLVETLKGRLKVRGITAFTRSLIVVQFALAIFLMSGTRVMVRQLDFLKTTRLGVHAEQVVVIPTHTAEGERLLEPYRSALQNNPNVVQVSGSDATLSREATFSMGYTETKDGTWFFPHLFRVGPDYLQTLGLTLAAGRDFSDAFGTDEATAVLVNEALVREAGWTAPVGETLTVNGTEVHVIGVVADFQYQSLHHPVAPALLHRTPEDPIRHLLVRIRPDQVPETLEQLRAAWQAVAPDFPFDYAFLDDDFAQQYHAEERWSRIVSYTALFATLIAGLGLFGLAALAAAGRTKEIGIRKVMGATVTQVTLLLSRDFARLVLLANGIAWPLTYLVMHRWLDDFAYRIEISWWIFLMVGSLVLAVALSTVSFQAIKAALTDPVKALRYE